MIFFVAPNGDDHNNGGYHDPMGTIPFAVNRLQAGDTLYIRGGEYVLTEPVTPKTSGTDAKPIIIAGYPGEEAVINADGLNFFRDRERYRTRGEHAAVFVYEVSYITVKNITVTNSHGHGIAVRDADHITVDGCTTRNTFSCGISLWDTRSTGKRCHHNKIVGNTVINATTWDMLPEGARRGNEPPHEAISVAGACYFEVCFNHVYDCFKEGIDVKENSHHGSVHHNHVHHVERQGLYADAWFGAITHVDFYENDVHDCQGAGIVVAVEQGHYVSNVRIYGNRISDIWGTGMLFGTFGADGPRHDIEVCNNIIKNCGGGRPEAQEGYFWITGGLCLLSANLRDCKIHHNVFEGNTAFDIGCSDKYLAEGRDIGDALVEKNIVFYENLFLDSSKFEGVTYPIKTPYVNNEILYGGIV